MKPIVLATDGSPSAAEAMSQAVMLAQALGAPLVAVSIEHVTIPAYGYYGYADLVTELTKMESEHVHETLAQVKAAAEEAGVECECVHGVGTSAAAEQICEVADKHDAQMIVIGAHGWGTVRRLLHGSVSTAVLHTARCPVLIVRGAAVPPANDPEKQLAKAAQ